jgi:hypothetical protein
LAILDSDGPQLIIRPETGCLPSFCEVDSSFSRPSINPAEVPFPSRSVWQKKRALQ